MKKTKHIYQLKNIFLLIILIGFVACNTVPQTSTNNKKLSIIPQPETVKFTSGNFTIRNNTKVYFNNKELLKVTNYMNDKLSGALGFDLKKMDGTGKGINLIILDEKDKYLGNEGYKLKIEPKNINVVANEANGIFYGVQSLLQMLPPQIKSKTLQENIQWNIPCAEIKDKPRFIWRGLMLDVSRHFFTKEEVKEYIDQLAEYKMNVFHWHLTDDQGWRIEIKSLPKLTEKGAWRAERVGDWWQREPQQGGEATTYGGFYTHDDIKEVVEYAKERFVEIVPEINMEQRVINDYITILSPKGEIVKEHSLLRCFVNSD